MIITRKLHQLTPNTEVIERNKRNHDSSVRQAICITKYSPNEYEELAFLQPKDFEQIFETTDGNRKDKSFPIVKITNPRNKKYVYRAFRTSTEIRGFKDYIAISYTGINQLTDNQEERDTLNTVQISKGSRIGFYWFHPNHATKIATRMGVISIGLGIISILLSIVPCIIKCLSALIQ